MFPRGLTAAVADFAVGTTFGDIPAEVNHLGRKSILDALGPAIVGAITPTCEVLQGYLAGLGLPAQGATVIGTAQRLPARFAALANGTATHADDYDDTMQAATGKFQGIHPTAPVLSALLARAETSGRVRSGRELLHAYQVGVEVACKLFDATAPEHILNGFHSTGTCGLLGAAVAVSVFDGASAATIRTALGIAASSAAGLQENFGTMTKPYHAGPLRRGRHRRLRSRGGRLHGLADHPGSEARFLPGLWRGLAAGADRRPSWRSVVVRRPRHLAEAVADREPRPPRHDRVPRSRHPVRHRSREGAQDHGAHQREHPSHAAASSAEDRA